MVRMSCTVIRLVCLRRGMLPPDLFQDRQSAATQQPMTNRHAARNCPGLSEIPVRDLLKCVSGTYRNCCPGLRETRSWNAGISTCPVEGKEPLPDCLCVNVPAGQHRFRRLDQFCPACSEHIGRFIDVDMP